jgi:hypothetical protein
MVVSSETFIKDVIGFIKTSLVSNVTDPIASTRGSSSKFIMTSYPQRPVEYPIITIKVTNQTANRAGMQTTAMDVSVNIEVRVWARNQKEKDEIANEVYNDLKGLQFTTSTGSIANYLYNFTLISATEIDETGEGSPKSRIMTIKYNFYDV